MQEWLIKKEAPYLSVQGLQRGVNRRTKMISVSLHLNPFTLLGSPEEITYSLLTRFSLLWNRPMDFLPRKLGALTEALTG